MRRLFPLDLETAAKANLPFHLEVCVLLLGRYPVLYFGLSEPDGAFADLNWRRKLSLANKYIDPSTSKSSDLSNALHSKKLVHARQCTSWHWESAWNANLRVRRRLETACFVGLLQSRHPTALESSRALFLPLQLRSEGWNRRAAATVRRPCRCVP